MPSAKQIAGNQKRSVRAIIQKIEKMAADFSDTDGFMEAQAELFKGCAEEYLDELQRYIDDVA